ncbi:amidase [Microbacterium sp. SYP-A9085]|uniref:amidase n=1 Tax=Microbacterium sp. SYP-A9085 TaxID=2664454 RepID=UPI00129B1161
MTESIAFLPASRQLAEFRAKTLSPVEVLREQLGRDERHGAIVNAFTERMYDDALHSARAAERVYSRAGADDVLPSLLGVTVAVKASHDMAGRTVETGAHAASPKRIAAKDHPVVASLRRAGAILHARTTTPEFNCSTVTHSAQWGVTRNPWNLSLSPGGSSGGSAAAVAAGMSTLATASDIAGSIRIPATFSGLVGLKPPWGWTAGDGPMSADRYLVQGGLARTVADSVLLLRAMLDSSPGAGGAPESLPLPTEGIRPLRIALSRDLGGYLIDDDVEANLLRTAADLEALGHTVHRIDIALEPSDVHAASFAHFGHIFVKARNLEAGPVDELAPYTRAFLRESLHYANELSYYDSMVLEHRIRQRILATFDEYDILLCPTSGIASLPADGNFDDGMELGGGARGHYWQRHLTLPFNIVDAVSVVSVPNGLGAAGIPTSVQMSSPRISCLLDLASQIEQLGRVGSPTMG